MTTIGITWAAFGITLIAVALIALKLAFGQFILALSQLIWGYYAFRHGNNALLFQSIVLGTIALLTGILWS